MTDLYVSRFDRRRDPRLGRQVVHDPRSLSFPTSGAIDTSTWKTKTNRIYDPSPTPNQAIGNCTGCAKSTQLNAANNRQKGVVLNMGDADRIYSLATTLDPWPGNWPPDDTGSSGLAAAKAAQQLGLGGAYYWNFRGAQGVIQLVQDGWAVNIGSRWDWQMFEQDSRKRIEPGGGVAGGHEWTVFGWDEDTDEEIARCWWSDEWRYFRIRSAHLDELLADDGDSHVQVRA